MNKKLVVKEFKENGLGRLYFDLYAEKIDNDQFLEKLETIENRPVMRLGRFFDELLISIFPFLFRK